jgi:hemerythrin-like metal-binding domain
MALMAWTEEFRIGIERVDEQHRHLVDLINQLYEAMREGKGSLKLGGIIKELVDYSVEHFSTEEEMFIRRGYAQAQAHKAEHAAFVAKVSDFQREFEAGKIGVTMDVLDFLTLWLKDHILKSDKAYASFLIGAGER